MRKRKIEYEFSAAYRLAHWIKALAIVALIPTGFYLAYAFITPAVSNEPILFLNAKFRMWHQIAGFLLIAVTIFKVYLFIADKFSRVERVSFLDFVSPKVWIAQIKYYLFLGEHPELRGAYNPLQFMAYLFLYLIVAIECLTGLVLYIHVFHEGLGGALYDILRPIEAMMGGLANVREIHHIAMWYIIIFVPIHIYMSVFNSIMGKEGALGAIISGCRFKKQDH